MRRKLNFKLLGIVLGTFLVLAVAVHYLHSYQLTQNAHRVLERGDRALEAKDHDKALLYYGQYLLLVPNDPDTVQKYAQILDRRATSIADRLRLVSLMEQVLRAKSGEHALRFRLIENLITLDRMSEAMDHLRNLERKEVEKPRVLHMLGWCLDASQKHIEAARKFEEAIKAEPTQIESYALLAEVLQDRLTQPDEALAVMNRMVLANPESYQAYLQRARFQLRRGDQRAADVDLQMAYHLGPDRAEVILAVADAARLKGNWDEATRLLQAGLKQFPNDGELWKEIVWVKLHINRRDEAITLAKDALRNVPKSVDLAILLVDLLIDQKHYEEAQTRIDELLKAGLKPTLPNYLLARLKIAQQDWTDGTKLLEEVRQDLGPGTEWGSRVNVLLGLCYRQSGDHDLEVRAFRRAVEEEPTWLVASVGLASALLDVGRVVEASQTLEPLRNMKDVPADYWVVLARCRLARQMRLQPVERRWDDVEEALKEAVKATPKSVDVRIASAGLLAARGDLQGAKSALENARTEFPADVAIVCALADLAARHDRFAEADAILEQAARDKTLGDRIELRLAQCRLWGQRGNAEDRAKLARLNDNLPGTVGLLERARLNRELADTWYRLNEGNRAEAHWRAVARALPKDLRSRAMLFDVALEKQQLDAARVWLKEIRDIEGVKGPFGRWGDVAIQIQQSQGRRSIIDEARKSLLELDKLHKNWPRTPLLSATLFELEGQYHHAIQEYIRALELGEIPPRSMARLLTLLVERHEFSKAETELAKYEQKLPLTRDLARLGAEIAVGMRDKRFAKLAVLRAEQAVPLPARDYRDLLWLAKIHHGVGQTETAQTLLRDCLEQAGHVPDVWIAWMDFLTQTNQRSRAETDLEKMKQELPANLHALTLARCYEALRQPALAAKAYQAALQARPDDFLTLAYAADFYRRADQLEEAKRLYRSLLDPARSVPAEFTAPARRQLAALLASSDRQKALSLLEVNQKTRGHTLADERVRLYVQSLASASARQESLNRFQHTLRVAVPTPDERVLFARMLESAGNVTQACSQLSEAVDESPTPTYLAPYVHMLIANDDLPTAERQIELLAAWEPASERVAALRAALDRAKKQPPAKTP